MKSNSGKLRDKILEAATKILCESGLKKLAQPQIAKEANIRQSHLTYYFPKRSDLILAVTEKTLALLNAQMPRGVVGKSVYTLVAKLLKDTDRTRALIGLMVESDENPELRQRLKDLSIQHEKLLASAAGRPEGDIYVSLAHAAMYGIGIQIYLHGNAKARETETALKALTKWMDLAPVEKKRGKRKDSHATP